MICILPQDTSSYILGEKHCINFAVVSIWSKFMIDWVLVDMIY